MAKVKLNMNGFLQVRRSAGVRRAVTRQAEAIGARANSMSRTRGAAYKVHPVRDSEHGSIALVSTDTYQARVDNAYHNTLNKAVK